MSKPSNILIVDDTPENLTVLRDILTRCGYRVRPVLQGALALKSAMAEPPDLILLDIMMPEMDGFEVCQQLKAENRTRDVPILFISALDATASKVRGFEAGALDYIIKPFQAEEVVARVRTHLALYAAQRQLKIQNEELSRAARLREDVDRMLRHDLRGPLSNMIGYAELITDDMPTESKVAKYGQVIASAGYAMLNMIHSSFDLMKMERGEYLLRVEPFDVVEVVHQILVELAVSAEVKFLRFQLSFADQSANEVVVLGEALLSRSLFYNLLKNAVEASPEGETIKIHFAGRQDITEISVRNVGPVPETVRDRFFEKYITTGKAGGTGLGTFSAKLMTETQHGQIRLDTSESGHTTIVVQLPRASAADKAFFQSRRAEMDGIPAKRFGPIELPSADLLIADDSAANRAYLQHILPTPPLRLHFANNGAEALNALQELPLTAALIDLEMPGMDGIELVKNYREWHRAQESVSPAAVMIAFSGHQDSGTRERCLRAGFDRILSKTIAKSKLYEELREALVFGSSIVMVDRAIQNLIPEFLESQRCQIDELETFIAQGDKQGLRSAAHRLQGSLAMYGFGAASRMCDAISETAQSSDMDRAQILTDTLRAHLTSLEIRYI